jgi:3-oxoadipate enol-lactonase
MARIDTHFRVNGPDAKPWVTFITGIANDLWLWEGQVSALARDFRVLRYDLRGQGGTPPTPPPYAIDLLVADLIDLWDRIGVGTSHLVGLGLGGALAQAAAIRHPDRIGRLAPCCCRARMVPEFAKLWRELIATVEAKGIEPIVEATVERWFSEAFKAANPRVLDDVRAMIRRTSAAGYVGCASAFLGLDIERDLGSIRAPTLFISGALDQRGGPPALMASLAEKVPGARHASVPQAAHIANVENPPGFNRVLADFLAEA